MRGGANVLDVNMDADLLDSVQAMRTFLNVIAANFVLSTVLGLVALGTGLTALVGLARTTPIGARRSWKGRVAARKFSKYPNYGLAPAGLIGLQGDHPGALAIRAIRIREWP